MEAGARQAGLEERAVQYEARGLQLAGNTNPPPQPPVLHATGESEMSRAYNLLAEALQLDEGGKPEEALEQYKLAVQVCLDVKDAVSDREVKEKLSGLAKQALERAEKLQAGPEQSSPRLFIWKYLKMLVLM